jgi:hypothetical protein
VMSAKRVVHFSPASDSPPVPRAAFSISSASSAAASAGSFLRAAHAKAGHQLAESLSIDQAAVTDPNHSDVWQDGAAFDESASSPCAHGHAAAVAAGAAELDTDHGRRRYGRDDPDVLALLLQKGPLLDVQLQEGVDPVLWLVQRLLHIGLCELHRKG